jgi:uncharacterized protein Yka (UPF0111/DUF47 family)
MRSLSENNIPEEVDPIFRKMLALLESLGKQVHLINERMEKFEEERLRDKEENLYSVDMSQIDVNQVFEQKENTVQNEILPQFFQPHHQMAPAMQDQQQFHG